MKKLLITLLAACSVSGAAAQELKTIKLDAPDKHRGVATMQAFDKRRSTREFSTAMLSMQDLSDLVWAANGYNRPADKKRTAPTAMNRQEIDIYVCMRDGAYLYDAGSHELRQVTTENVIPHIAANQASVNDAPVCILIVADMGRAGGDNEGSRMWTAYDAGIVSQNISIFCAGCGFATVPRGFMDKKKIAEALGFDGSKVIHLNHPVSYFK